MTVADLVERARARGACDPGIAWAATLDQAAVPPAATGPDGIRAWLAWAAARAGVEWAGWCVGRMWPVGLLSGADLAGANLTGAVLAWTELTGAVLAGADLTRAFLREADLSGADLAGANLTRATLRWADLAGATLRGADLRGADLAGATLRGATLRWADLTGARRRPTDPPIPGWVLTAGRLAGEAPA